MPETCAYFYILGFECDPAVITSHLSLEPTKIWRRGDAHPRRKNHFFDCSGWELDSALPRDGYDLDALVRALVDRLHPLADRLAALPPHKSKGINCVGYYFSENPGFHLTADLAGKIGRLGLEVDFDLYNLRDSDELYFMRVPEEPNQSPEPTSGLTPGRGSS